MKYDNKDRYGDTTVMLTTVYPANDFCEQTDTIYT